jgi:hypothetical protein
MGSELLQDALKRLVCVSEQARSLRRTTLVLERGMNFTLERSKI